MSPTAYAFNLISDYAKLDYGTYVELLLMPTKDLF